MIAAMDRCLLRRTSDGAADGVQSAQRYDHWHPTRIHHFLAVGIIPISTE